MHGKRPCLTRWGFAAFTLCAGLGLCSQVLGAGIKVRLLEADGRPLSDAVVFLESPSAALASKPLPGLEIAQNGKRFIPSVSIVPLGSAVSFPNRDTVRHHVYSFSPAKPFELKLYSGVPANPVKFDRPGVVVLGCNIHDVMIGWVLVVNTPYYGKTDSNGELILQNIHPGSYHLRLWHSTLPPGVTPLDRPLVLGADEAVQKLELRGVFSEVD